MSATTSGLLIMTLGMAFIGGAYSFYRQKLPWLAQGILLLLGLSLASYGFYIVLNYGS